ncbi:glycosyltransferase family 2 protein [Candidatus Daviesbacteria bacterium]|nr:glycosyltransferase family 2 protein [Candidatus Daviesbacteria bacterium]
MDRKTKKWPKVSIVLPLFKEKKIPYILHNSLKKLAYPHNKLNLIIVEIIEKVKPLKLPGIKVKKIFIADRIGYSKAANIAVSKANSQFIFLINPDIKLEKNVLNIMIESFIKDIKTAIVGPKIYSLSKPKKISSFDLPGMNFNSTFGLITPIYPQQLHKLKKDTEVDWISGSIMLFKKSLWVEIGGFNEKYFLYWEDADFCLSAKKRGYKVLLVSKAKAWHQGSATISRENVEKIYYLTRNGKYFINTYSSFFGKIVQNINNFFLFNVKLFRFVFQPINRLESLSFMIGIIDFYLKATDVNKHKFLKKQKINN